MYTQSKKKKVTNQQRTGKIRWIVGVYCKTAAVKFVPAYNIGGKADNKGQQHSINDQSRGARIYADDQCQTGNEFNKRQNDGGKVDNGCREKIVAEYYFSKVCRSQDFAVTRIYKGCTEYPARGQLDPTVK